MAESPATQASRGHRTLCLPFEEESYRRVVGDPAEFRRVVDACFRDAPELFPAGKMPEEGSGFRSLAGQPCLP